MKRLTIVAGLLLAAAPAASAQDANAWVEKLSKLAGKAFSTDITMNVASEAMTMASEGHMSFGDKKHFAMDMKMQMTMPAMGMADPMTMSMRMVADGTTLWMDIDSPMMGGRQVMKMGVELMDKLGESGMGGMGSLSGSSEMDPVSQMMELAEMVDFGKAKVEGGRVMLSGPLNEKGMENMGEATAQLGVDITDVSLVLDEKTGFPIEFAMGTPEQKIITAQYKNPTFHDKMDMSLFAYTPPEGVTPIDMGAMMGGGGGESSEF